MVYMWSDMYTKQEEEKEVNLCDSSVYFKYCVKCQFVMLVKSRHVCTQTQEDIQMILIAPGGLEG